MRLFVKFYLRLLLSNIATFVTLFHTFNILRHKVKPNIFLLLSILSCFNHLLRC